MHTENPPHSKLDCKNGPSNGVPPDHNSAHDKAAPHAITVMTACTPSDHAFVDDSQSMNSKAVTDERLQ